MRLYARIALPLLAWLFIGAVSRTTTADDIIPVAAIYAFASMVLYELLGVAYAYFHKEDSRSIFDRPERSLKVQWIYDHYFGLFTLCYVLVPAVVLCGMWSFGFSFHALDDTPTGIFAALGKLFVGCFFLTVVDVVATFFDNDDYNPHSPWSKQI